MRTTTFKRKMASRLVRLLCVSALTTAGITAYGQESHEWRRMDFTRAKTKLGAITLSESFSATGFRSATSRRFGLRRQLLQSAVPKGYLEQDRAADDDFACVASPLGFPETRFSGETGFAAEEITPVAEPGTWLAAIFATGFALVNMRKRLRQAALGLGRHLRSQFNGLAKLYGAFDERMEKPLAAE